MPYLLHTVKVSSSTAQIDCLISGPSHRKDPLLEISNKTFIEELTKDSQLSCIHNEILQKGCSEKFSKYFIHPDSKVLMFIKENTINNTFSYLIIVTDSLRNKVLTISHFSHFHSCQVSSIHEKTSDFRIFSLFLTRR